MRFPFNWAAFPSTDYNKINLDWIFDTLKKLVAGQDAMDAAVKEAQQAAADAEAAAAGITGAVKYDSAQALDATEQAQARSNIGAASASDLSTTDATATAAATDAANAVSYATAQTLTAPQQAQARTNIGAASAADLSTTDATATAAATAAADTVKYTAQALTSPQQAQARTNIGAASAADIVDFSEMLKLHMTGSVSFSGVTGLSVTRNSLRYAINTDKTVGKVYGNLLVEMTGSFSGSTVDLPIIGLQVHAPDNPYDISLNGIVVRTNNSSDSIDIDNVTRLYAFSNNEPRLHVDISGNVSFRWNYISSGTVGNCMFFWIPPCLLLFDEDSNP